MDQHTANIIKAYQGIYNLQFVLMYYESSPSTPPFLNLSLGTEEGAEEAKQALLKAVGKVTDIVSSLGFSWWQGGPPHTQSLKDLHWVSIYQPQDVNLTNESDSVFKHSCLPYIYIIFTVRLTLQVMETLLYSTFVSWKVFFPLVRDNSSCTYTLITGD